MSIKFLNVTAEEAVDALTKVIEVGYEIKIDMDTEYSNTKEAKGGVDNSSVQELVVLWEIKVNAWFRETIQILAKIYTSKRMAYEFREAQPQQLALQSTDDNPKWFSVSRSMKAKLDKLNEFDNFIKREFRVQIDYIAGDKFENSGSGDQNVKK